MARTLANLNNTERQSRRLHLKDSKRRRKRVIGTESIDFTDINRAAPPPPRLSDSELRRRANSRRYVDNSAGVERNSDPSEEKRKSQELKQALDQALDQAELLHTDQDFTQDNYFKNFKGLKKSLISKALRKPTEEQRKKQYERAAVTYITKGKRGKKLKRAKIIADRDREASRLHDAYAEYILPVQANEIKNEREHSHPNDNERYLISVNNRNVAAPQLRYTCAQLERLGVNKKTTCVYETKLARDKKYNHLFPHITGEKGDRKKGKKATWKGVIKTGNLNCQVIPSFTKFGKVRYRLASECDHCHRAKSTWLKQNISGGNL